MMRIEIIIIIKMIIIKMHVKSQNEKTSKGAGPKNSPVNQNAIAFLKCSLGGNIYECSEV